jgi:hypothetical protein
MRSGWFKESHRHSLAARGITTRQYMVRKSPLRRLAMRTSDDALQILERRKAYEEEKQFRARMRAFNRDSQAKQRLQESLVEQEEDARRREELRAREREAQERLERAQREVRVATPPVKEQERSVEEVFSERERTDPSARRAFKVYRAEKSRREENERGMVVFTSEQGWTKRGKKKERTRAERAEDRARIFRRRAVRAEQPLREAPERVNVFTGQPYAPKAPGERPAGVSREAQRVLQRRIRARVQREQGAEMRAARKEAMGVIRRVGYIPGSKDVRRAKQAVRVARAAVAEDEVRRVAEQYPRIVEKQTAYEERMRRRMQSPVKYRLPTEMPRDVKRLLERAKYPVKPRPTSRKEEDIRRRAETSRIDFDDLE